MLVPPGFRRSEIEPLLQRQARWLLKHWLVPSRPPVPPRAFVAGESFSYLGQDYLLTFTTATRRPQVTLGGNELWLSLNPNHHTAVEIRRLLIDWYRVKAAELLTARLNHWAPVVGAAPTDLRLKEFKTRWGYCRRDGLIALNWRIVQASLPVIDYLVVHELSHLLHPHHQPAFWTAVAEVIPDYRDRRSWLRMHGAELIW